jgi:hypothetical protein
MFCMIWGLLAVTMKNAVFWDIKTQFVFHKKHISAFFAACFGCYLLLARSFLSPWWWWWYVPPKHRFLQEPQGVTSQKTAFPI